MIHTTEDAAIEAAKAELLESNGLIEFSGQNCNDHLSDDAEECGGWDGFDTRCVCGNRRVFWEAYGDAESGFIAHGQAD